MSYPSSSDVLAGQPTSYLHYNTLRADAVYLGNLPADSATLAQLLTRYTRNLVLVPLATNRLRVPYDASFPCCIVIRGYLCIAAADIDLPALTFSGVAATWYIFANRTAGSTTFTLTANTSLTETADQRRIARIDWDGSNLVYPSLMVYNQGRPGLYYAQVSRVAVQSINTATPTAISFDTEDADTDGMYAAAAPTRVTIVHPGLYLITAYVTPAASGGYTSWAYIYLNNTTNIGGNNVAGVAAAAPIPCVTIARYLQAGDYLELYTSHNQGGAVNHVATLTAVALSA